MSNPTDSHKGKGKALPTVKREGTIKSPGRPVGAKSKTTIFKEVMREGFEERLQKDFRRVLNAVIEKAVDGDMTAAKLLMDRVIPVQKSIDLDDLDKGKGLSISINIGSLEENNQLPIDAEYTTDAD